MKAKNHLADIQTHIDQLSDLANPSNEQAAVLGLAKAVHSLVELFEALKGNKEAKATPAKAGKPAAGKEKL